MAGIGFELRKILRHDSYVSEFTAYLYAALISSGPWLLSVVCLSVLGLFRQAGGVDLGAEIFRSTVIVSYASSLILVGVIQLVSTRYLADQYYVGNQATTLPAFFTSAAIVLALAAPVAVLGYWAFDLDPVYKAMAVVLILVVSLIWLAMIFLSAVKDYRSIVYAFASGSLLSVAGAVLLKGPLGEHGFLLGYLAGQAVIFFWLMSILLAEFPSGPAWDPGLFSAWRRFWDLSLIGVGYNMAIWADKIVFWFAPDSRMIIPYFRTHDLYEAPIFFAYLSIVPTLATFLIKIETRFYGHYHDYYAKIMAKRDLRGILEEKAGMVRMLKESLREVFILQGGLTCACLAFAPGLAELTGLSPLQIPLLRIAFIGAFLQALLSMAVIILFYFDQRRKVLATTQLFLATNVGFTWLSIQLGLQFYGYGYCYSCLVSLLFAGYLLDRCLKDLEYITFAGQPLA
ncbi:MAG: exopolysaccharide Pel transporter PelG [Desulfovibrionaceae bacterium]